MLRLHLLHYAAASGGQTTCHEERVPCMDGGTCILLGGGAGQDDQNENLCMEEGVRCRYLLKIVAGCAEKIGCWPVSNADNICCMVDGRL